MASRRRTSSEDRARRIVLTGRNANLDLGGARRVLIQVSACGIGNFFVAWLDP